jgi:YgiT-type zinc finger domain-containing protein
MICVICGVGELKPGRTTSTLSRDDRVVIIHDVPALVCSACGEDYSEPEINGQVLALAEKLIAEGEALKVASFESTERRLVIA